MKNHKTNPLEHLQPYPLMRTAYLIRIAGLSLGVAWAGFWMVSGIPAGMDSGGTPSAVVFGILIPGGLFSLCVLIALRWNLEGGLLLMGVSVLPLFFFDLHWYLVTTMVAPPFLSGAALVGTTRLRKHRQSASALPPNRAL